MFKQEATTTQIATFLCCAIWRAREECGKDYPWRLEDDELALYAYLIDLIQHRGYQRHDGCTGIIDGATGLPMYSGGETNHPPCCSFLAHAANGAPFRLSPPPNIATELWLMSRSRRSWRMTSLFATVDAMMPTLSSLREALVRRGIFKAHRDVQFRPSNNLAATWQHNGQCALFAKAISVASWSPILTS